MTSLYSGGHACSKRHFFQNFDSRVPVLFKGLVDGVLLNKVKMVQYRACVYDF